MALEIGLGGNVDAVFVAEIIPERIVGIMTGTHCIEVMGFHDGDILEHPLGRHHISSIGIKFMAVSALYQHRLPVDKHIAVAHLNFAETYFHRHLLAGGGRNRQRIKIRCLGAPCFHSGNLHLRLSAFCRLSLGNLIPFSIRQHEVELLV